MNEPLWLTEAYKHNNLKEVPGPGNNATIVKWLIALKAWWKDDLTPWCLYGDTEVLTDVGFVRFDELKKVNPKAIAQLNTETRKIEYVSDYGYIEKDYDGEVYNNKKLGLICDPEHAFYGRWTGTGRYHLRNIKNLTSYGVNIPVIFSGENDYPISDEEIIFLAAFLSDGYYRENSSKVRFGFSKTRKEEIMKIFPALNVIEEKPRENRFPVRRYTYDISLLRKDVLSEYKLMKWEFIRSLSTRQAKLFVDTYSNFDGTIDEYGNYELFTADKRLQEQLCFIATIASYKATPYSTKQVSSNTKIEYLHNVYVSNRLHRSVKLEHIVKEQYKGKLYCVQVPSMVFIIRTTKGVIIPIGNCGTFVAHCLKTAKRKYPKHWYRAKAYLEYGTKLSKPAYGCIAITGRQGGGHVFFVVGQTEKGDIVGYGGNQGDAVNKRIFKKDAILGYRWPDKEDGSPSNPLPERYNLPVYNSRTLSVIRNMA